MKTGALVTQALSIVFGIIAAAFWFCSARIHIPDHIPPSVDTGMGVSVNKALMELGPALQRQSKFSAIAAVFTGLSSILSAISMFLLLLSPTN